MRGYIYSKLESFFQTLARRMIRRHQPKIIAVTGSVGKTTTVRAIQHVLSDAFFIWNDLDSKYNDSLSIPLSVLGIKRDPRNKIDLMIMFIQSIFYYHRVKKYPKILVFEIRTRKPGDISSILSILGAVDIAVFTPLSDMPPHLEFFQDYKEYINEKKTLSKYIKKNGFAVYDYDSELTRALGEKIQQKKRSVGFDPDADYFAENPHYTGKDFLDGVGYKLHYKEQNAFPIRMNDVFAFHHIFASLAAIAVARELGINLVDINNRLATFSPPHQRMECKSGVRKTLVVDDTYNAAPASVNAALTSMKLLNGSRRRVAVLGDMLELGERSEEGHRIVGQKAGEVVHVLVGYGNASRFIVDEAKSVAGKNIKAYHFTQKEELIEMLRDHIIRENDIVLVKGSRMLHMENVVDAIVDTV